MENWLIKRAKNSPNQMALHTSELSLTFAELYQRVEAKASQISQYDIIVGGRVGILGKNNLAAYEIILACQQLGFEMVLLNSRLAVRELNMQLKDAKVEVCFVADSLSLNGDLVTKNVLFSAVADLPVTREPRIQLEFTPNKVTSIMYTSGTTGFSKGVMQTFDNHFYSAVGSALNLGLSPEDGLVCVVPIFHISGFSIMMRSLIYGVPVYLLERFDPEEVNELLIQGGPTIISVVPTMLKQMLLALPNDVHYHSTFRCALLGGGPIDEATLAACQKQGIPVIQSYGMTETASQVVALNFKDATRKLGSSGQALFPVQIKISEATKPNEVGEILIKSPTLTPGYLHQQYTYLERMTGDNWFHTGDAGYLDDENFLYVQGRYDDMIISGGENIFPFEIETVYANFPELSNIIVIGNDDEKWGQVPIAFVKLSKESNVTAADLIEFGQAHLAHFKVPKHFYQISHLPKTASGKVQRHKLVIDPSLEIK